MPPSPRNAPGPSRPPLAKRHSSASSHGHNGKLTVTSPTGSQTEHFPPRHAVRPKNHARVMLPRNHSSGRNLAKLARQVNNANNAAGHGNGDGVAGRHHTRDRSHEGDTEIRLPGSLDESVQSRPTMRRNMTALQLPRNTSHTKLKKNLSHGALQRLNSGRNLSAVGHGTSAKMPASPAFKGKHKRMKSVEVGSMEREKDLHEQEVELAQQLQDKRDGAKKVGFAVGSVGDSSGGEDDPEMEGSGLEEGDWTDQSASASPFSTRQNTANNSRRESAAQENRPASNQQFQALQGGRLPFRPVFNAADADALEEVDTQAEADGTPAGSYDPDGDEQEGSDEEVQEGKRPTESVNLQQSKPSLVQTAQPPQSLPLRPQQQSLVEKIEATHLEHAEQDAEESEDEDEHDEDEDDEDEEDVDETEVEEERQYRQAPAAQPQHALHIAKQHANPTTGLLGRASGHVPAPALVSNVTAMDDSHSTRGSPAGSLRAGEQDQDELVSRFIPSTSHPSFGSGGNTTMNTPKSGAFHTPPEFIARALAARSRHDGIRYSQNSHTSSTPQPASSFGVGPVSPGSTVSGSSGHTTPAMGRSRIELKMLQEKAIADMESAAEKAPMIPAHVYDRRNESLKSYLQLAALAAQQQQNQQMSLDGRSTPGHLTPGGSLSLAMGPEVFQGRFKAVGTELRVVQKFRNPIAESVSRLQTCKGTRVGSRTAATMGSGVAKLQAQAAQLRVSKSAVSLPAARQQAKGAASPLVSSEDHSKTATAVPSSTLSSSSGPASVEPGLPMSKSSVTIAGGRSAGGTRVGSVGSTAAMTAAVGSPRRQQMTAHRGVNLAGSSPQTRDGERVHGGRGSEGVAETSGGADAIARSMWESVVA